jgi:hypothetical protein
VPVGVVAVAVPVLAGPATNADLASFARLFTAPATALAGIGAAQVPNDPVPNRLRTLLQLQVAGTATAADVSEAARLATRLGLLAAVQHAARPARSAEADQSGMDNDESEVDGRAEPDRAVPQQALPQKVNPAEALELGREDYKYAVYDVASKSGSRRPKDKVSEKLAGDHVFNEPFSVVAAVLIGDSPLVAAARARIELLAAEWTVIRDGLRAYEVPSREGVFDANSLAFGLFSEQLRDLVQRSRKPSALPAISALLDRMFATGIVDRAAYAEVLAKDEDGVRAADRFLAEHRADLDRALRTLLEVRGEAGPYLLRLRFVAARYLNAVVDGKPPTGADLSELRDLQALLGEGLFDQEVSQLPGRRSLVGKRVLTAEHLTGLCTKAGQRPATAPSPGTSTGTGQAGPGPQQGAPVQVLHEFGHFHLLLPLPQGGVVDVDVQPDGSCLAHAAVWADLLAAGWATWLATQHGPVNLDLAKDWLTGKFAEQAVAEGAAMTALRQAIGAHLAANRLVFRAGILESLMNLLGTAHAENPDNDDPATWHFPEAGDPLGRVLAVFAGQHADELLDWRTDVLALVVTEPMLIDAYIEAVTSDPRMWLGPAEVCVLQAIRAVQGRRPVQVCLPGQTPPVHLVVHVPMAPGRRRAEKSSTSQAASGGAGLLAVPKWKYTKLRAACFLNTDIGTIFNAANWQQGQQSGHVFVCTGIPAPLELHASLTQKAPYSGSYVNQIEFVLMRKADDGPRDRTNCVRWWYWIKRLDAGAVRLEFDGNISASDVSTMGDANIAEAVRKQQQSDENERSYARYLQDSGFDAAAEITAIIARLEGSLTTLPVCVQPQQTMKQTMKKKR